MPESWRVILTTVVIILIGSVLLVLISVGELYSQLGRYTRYWQSVNASADKDGFVYVAFGNSAAQGVGATKPQNGYVGLVAKALSEEIGEPVQTINLSKSGAKVADVLNTQYPAYEKLKLAKTPVITVEIGANDMLSFDEKKFSSEMDQLLGKLPKTAVVSDIPYFGGTRFSKVQPQVEIANSVMRKLAKKHGLRLVPLHDKVRSNTGLSTLAIDIFHPSNKAYRENWAPTFLAGIRSSGSLNK